MAENLANKYSTSDVITCPLCKAKTSVKKNSIVCKNKHSFDVAKQGYVNLLASGKNTDKYTKELFMARRFVYEKGIYREFENAIAQILELYLGREKFRILDCGCGEGYFLHKMFVSEKFPSNGEAVGIDISRPAIHMAALLNKNIKWLVADLQSMPLRKNRFDVILDILSPANYSEFARLLKKGGVVIKAVPGNLYLKELRELLGHKEYSNEKVLDYASSSFKLIGQSDICYTKQIDEETAMNIFKMSPMSFNVENNKAKSNSSKLKEITIDFKMLVLQP